MEIKTVQFDVSHMENMKGRIHQNNEAEARALFGDDVNGYMALKQSVEGSDEVFAVIKDNVVMAIFGIKEASLLSGRAFPWLVCSEDIMDYGITFLKRFRELMNTMKQKYRILDCLIFSDNTEVLKMLKWVGFKEASKETINGYVFDRMVWIRSGG
jgi:hypothetical protein